MRKMILLVALCAAGTVAARAADVKDFHKSWDTARKAAEAAGKPIFLHFTADGCTWCRKIEGEREYKMEE